MYYLVRDREQNLAYDSYFYATLFNPETLDYFEEEYGTTAFAGCAMHAEDLGGKITRHLDGGVSQEVEFTCDTPHEVRALFARVISVHDRLAYRKEMQEIAKDLGLNTYHEASRLTRAFPDWKYYKWTNADYFEFKAIYQLLKTKSFRSSFREGLAKQIREWVKDSTPKYAKPLSPKQMSFIVRR